MESFVPDVKWVAFTSRMVLYVARDILSVAVLPSYQYVGPETFLRSFTHAFLYTRGIIFALGVSNPSRLPSHSYY